MKMEIHLIRHGKTRANEESLYCGKTDLPLSRNGKEELESLVKRGIYPRADLVYTSGMLRARQSAGIIFGSMQISEEPGLNEFDFGLFEMKSYEELKYRVDYQTWISDTKGIVSCPQGESKLQFAKRVTTGYEAVTRKVRQAGGASAIIVCHGGVIVCIMEELFPQTRNFYEWQPEPGRGYTVAYSQDGEVSYIEIK